jgi:hypothetical protein
VKVIIKMRKPYPTPATLVFFHNVAWKCLSRASSSVLNCHINRQSKSLELLAIKNFPKRPLAPATEESYGEAGVLLATDYGELRNFRKLANVMAKGYGENACKQKIIAFGSFLGLSLSLSLSLSSLLSLSF